MFEIQSLETWQVQKKMVSAFKKDPNRTGPCVQWSKRPTLASRACYNVLWTPPKFGNKVNVGNKSQAR